MRGGDTLATTLDSMARHGVLYVRDVGGPLDVIAAIARRIANAELRGPTIFYGWEVGPAALQVSAQQAMARSLGVVVDPGTPLFQDLPVDTLLAMEVTSIEHAHAPWLSLLRADLRARHDSIAAPGVDPSRRGPFALEVISLGRKSFEDGQLRRLGEMWKRSGIFFCPTLRVSENRRRTLPPVPSTSSDEERARFWTGWADASVAVTRSLASQGIPLLIGQDDLEPMATFDDMELLARIGVPSADVLRAATLYPARSMKREADLGSIETGKVGDVVLFRGDPLENMGHVRSPWLVVQRGEVIHKRD